MNNDFLDSFAKPIESILCEMTYDQAVFINFALYSSDDQKNNIDKRQMNMHSSIGSKMVKIRNKMQLSFETLLLAFQINDSIQFRNLIGSEFNEKRKRRQNQKQQKQKLNSIERQQQQQYSDQTIEDQIAFAYSVGLLYICHKIIDDCQRKFTSNVWAECLSSLKQTKSSDILVSQNKILCWLEFQIIKPSIMTLVSSVLNQLKINNKKAYMLVSYLLELYISNNPKSFISINRKSKRVTIALSAIKLACHFLCRSAWKQSILSEFCIQSNQIDKYSNKLFALMLDKQKNVSVHSKYAQESYKAVSQLRLVNLRHFDKKNNCKNPEYSSQKQIKDNTSSYKTRQSSTQFLTGNTIQEVTSKINEILC